MFHVLPDSLMIYLLFQIVFPSPTAIWGWLGLGLFAAAIAIPYLVPNRAVVAGLSPNAPRAYLRGLWLHYWFGPLVLAISFLHAWIPMASGHMPHTSMRGLWLATYALGLILLQLLVGLALRYLGPKATLLVRRVHFVLMLGIAGLVLAHLWLNGPLAVQSAGSETTRAAGPPSDQCATRATKADSQPAAR